MIELRETQESDIKFIEACLKDKDEDFLEQCGYGRRFFEFPVTYNQILRFQKEIHPDSLFFTITKANISLGSFELMLNPDAKKSTVARLLIADNCRNMGYGTEALLKSIEYTFNILNYDKIGLSVYDFNKSALRCYEKAGFKIIDTAIRPNGWMAINMEINNPAL